MVTSQYILTAADSFYEVLVLRARQQPDDPAYQFYRNEAAETEQFTYAQLLERTNALVTSLGTQLRAGDRVVLSMPSCVEFVASFLACQALGVIAVPVPPPSRKRVDERLERILLDSKASAILSLGALVNDITLSDDQQLSTISLIAVDTLLSQACGELKSLSREGFDRQEVTFLQYTSGSTGDPKGVAITHHNLLHNSACIASLYALEGENHGVSWLPLFHDMGLIGGMLQPLFCGYPVTIMQPAAFLAAPMRWLQLISDLRATVTVCPNFALELCAERATAETLGSLDLSALQVLLCGAEPIHTATLDRFASVFQCAGFNAAALCPSYGLAEATLIVSGKAPGKAYGRQCVDRDLVAIPGQRLQASGEGAEIVSCGVLTQHAAVVDPESKRTLPDWTVGEIWVSDESVARGYWQRAEQSEAVFGNQLEDNAQAKRFMRTGDLGFLADGELYVTGRLKDLIIVRGKNVYPQDIERVASSVDPALAVGVAAAFAANDPADQLVVVLELTRHGLKAFADEHYANKVVAEIHSTVAKECGVIPAALCFVKPHQVRRTSSGKIRRVANRDAWQHDEFKSVHHWENNTTSTPTENAVGPTFESREAVEAWLVAHLASRCNLDARDVALDQPFVNFGLDSVAALELIAAMQARLPEGQEIDPTALWDFPTIAAMVSHLDSVFNAATPTQADSPPVVGADSIDADDEIAKLKALLG